MNNYIYIFFFKDASICLALKVWIQLIMNLYLNLWSYSFLNDVFETEEQKDQKTKKNEVWNVCICK